MTPDDKTLKYGPRLLHEAFELIDRNQNHAMLYSLGQPERFYKLPRSHEIMNFLLKYLAHPDYHASCAAASALGSLRFMEALPALKRRLGDPDSRVVWEVQRAIKMIESRGQIDAWLSTFRSVEIGLPFSSVKQLFGEPVKIRNGTGDIERVVRLSENPIDHARISKIVRVARFEPIEHLVFEFYFCDKEVLVAKHFSI